VLPAEFVFSVLVIIRSTSNVCSIDTSSAGSKQILGTCHGLIGYELGAAEVRIQDAIGRRAKLDRQDNLETLRAYQILG